LKYVTFDEFVDLVLQGKIINGGLENTFLKAKLYPEEMTRIKKLFFE